MDITVRKGCSSTVDSARPSVPRPCPTPFLAGRVFRILPRMTAAMTTLSPTQCYSTFHVAQIYSAALALTRRVENARLNPDKAERRALSGTFASLAALEG